MAERPAVRPPPGWATPERHAAGQRTGHRPARQQRQRAGAEWLTVTSTDATTATTYKLDTQPPQADTLLIDATEATTEADRRRDLWKTRAPSTAPPTARPPDAGGAGRHLDPDHARFGLAAGKTGIVVSIDRDWLKGRVTVGCSRNGHHQARPHLALQATSPRIVPWRCPPT